MMTVAYATLQDVYDLGLDARAFVMRPRVADPTVGDSLDFATGTFLLTGHDYRADDHVRLVLVGSGGALPGGASASTIYYPLPLDYWRFRLATSEGGPAVTFANAGTSTAKGASAWGVLLNPERRLSRILLAASAELDQDLTAYSTPLEPDPETGKYPLKVTAIVARMAARRALVGKLFDNGLVKQASERLDAEEKRDDAQREEWRKGQLLYPEPLDQTPALADNAMRAGNGLSSQACCRRQKACWVRGTL